MDFSSRPRVCPLWNLVLAAWNSSCSSSFFCFSAQVSRSENLECSPVAHHTVLDLGVLPRLSLMILAALQAANPQRAGARKGKKKVSLATR